MHGEEMEYIKEAYETNWISTVGENISAVEKLACQKTGAGHAVALSSGTAALHMAVKLAGERIYGKQSPEEGALYGRRVFCSDMTFGATVNPVVYEGGIPVFIDTEPDTWNMCPEALEKAFAWYPDVKVVVIAHLYGTPCKMDEIKAICDRQGALIVEDAAESLGAAYRTVFSRKQGRMPGTGNQNDCEKGILPAERYPEGEKAGYVWRQTGSFGDYSAISFNGNKIITGSAGGMLLTNDREAAEKARKWATQARENAPWYQHEELGYNYRMSNVIAGIVRGQFPHLEGHIKQKKAIYMRYRDAFKKAGLPVQMNPYDEENSEPNYWLSCLLIEEEAMCGQVRGACSARYVSEPGRSCPTEILETLEEYNAEGRPIWKPMHMQPIYRMHAFVTRAGDGGTNTNAYMKGKTVGIDGSPLDVGMDIFRRALCLPSDNKMTEAEQDRVIEIVKGCFE